MRPASALVRLAVLVLLGGAGCGSADFWYLETNNLSGGPTIFVVRWSDSPLEEAEAVVVALDRVELVGPDGTETLLDERRSFDLLQLRGGRYAEVARASVPAGPYSSLRFHLAPDGAGHHRVRLEGTDWPLRFATPGAGTIDLPYPLELDADAERVVHVDFNVRLSVTEAGGTWRLQPHLRGLDPDGAGVLVGEVRDGSGRPIPGATVSAQQGGTEVASTPTLLDGTFRLSPLAPGRYALVATAAGFAPAHLDQVLVSAGATSGSHLLFLDSASSGAVSGTAPSGPAGFVVHVLAPAGLVQIAGVDPLTGTFEIESLAPGTYAFELRDQRGLVGRRTGVIVSAGGRTNVDFP